MRQRLGEILIANGLLQPEELEKGLALQRERGDKLGRLLVEMGMLASRDVMAALAEQMHLPQVTAKQFPAIAVELEGLSDRFLKKFRILPLEVANGHLRVAMADPLDSESLAALRLATGKQVVVSLADDQEISAALEKFYPDDSSIALDETYGEGAEEGQSLEHLRDLASEAPVIRMVNQLISRAVERSASDIHLEPMERQFVVR